MAQPQPAVAAGVALHSGDVLPTVGLGTYKTPPKETEAAVSSALALGYRHIDTAQARGRCNGRC
jgi:diketogulonate reductase-like aldo/keto reductase